MNGVSMLVKISLPPCDVFLTDGGFLTYAGDTYLPSDITLGSIKSVSSANEEIGNIIPAIDITFNPAGPPSLTEFSQGAIQNSEVIIYSANYLTETNAIIGAPEIQFIGEIDQPVIRIDNDNFEISLTVVSHMESIFESDTGNALSESFHKSIYPGELGHDNAIGLTIPTAFGTFSPPTTSPISSGSGGGGGSLGGSIFRQNAR